VKRFAETALDVFFLCVRLRSSLLLHLKFISQAHVVVIVFFGALLRHAITELCPFFFLTCSHIRLEVATDVVLKFFFPNPDYSNSSS
jgi:hypothetical protein